jgi:membrane protein
LFNNWQNSASYDFIKKIILRLKSDALPDTSAQITYYLVLSFFPFLLFIINILSYTSLSEDLLFANFSTFLPSETGELVKKILLQTVQAKSTLLMIVGLFTALWTSSRGIAAIIRGVNKAYGVQENRSFVKFRATALFATLCFSLLIITALFALVFGEVIGIYIFSLVNAESVFPIVWSILRYIIPLFIMFVSLMLLYKALPNRKLTYKKVWPGALFTTFTWIVVSLLFSFYVNNFAAYEKIYGSIGGAIALLVWLYVSALIILVGGEINAFHLYLCDKKSNEEPSLEP